MATDNKFLLALREEIKKNDLNIYNISEYKDGNIDTVVVNPGNPCQDIYSVTKAFVVTAFGWLYDRGLLDLDAKVVPLFPEYERCINDKRFYDVTIDDVLQHKCGFKRGYMDCDGTDQHYYGMDFLEHIFSLDLECQPGTEFSYSDAAYYLASRIFTVLTGTNRKVDEMLWRNFMYPMGFFEAAWSYDAFKWPLGATGLYITNKDMTKLGALYLNKGVYDGQRYISEKWCDIVNEKQYEMRCIGIGQFYGKGGMRGQQVLVMPEFNAALGYQAFETKCDPGSILFPWIYENYEKLQ